VTPACPFDHHVTIYMPLLDEGIEVWKPVTAEHLGGDTFRALRAIAA
jgi:hypothetical protein